MNDPTTSQTGEPTRTVEQSERRVSVTELADLGYCEQQAIYKHSGAQGHVQPKQRQARQRGEAEHERRHAKLTRHTFGHTSDKRCFIATAVYGETAWQTNALRDWRDTALRPHAAGRALIQCYYALSPALAARLPHHPLLRHTTKRLLDRFVEKRLS